MAINDKAWMVGFKRLIGDESLGAVGGICVDTTNKQLHICDIADENTDWGLSASSHPDLFIHSATTPSTDYIQMYHDADNGYINVVGGTLAIQSSGTTKVSFASWGAVVIEGYHFYMNDDYTCYIGSSAANVLMVGTAAGRIEFRCGTHGSAITIDNDGLSTPYRIRVTGVIDFGASHSGTLYLPQKTEPITQPSEGTIWYNTSINKLEFSTGSAMETVTSS